MMVLVVGGSGSGKSSYAEKVTVSLAQESVKEITKSENTSLSDFKLNIPKKYYLATMQVFDDEGRKKVERHRNLRSGKGFFTIEQPTRISGALEKMEDGDRTVLLECISNLTANEMFSEKKTMTEIQVTENVIRDIKMLKEQTNHLVVVSNNIFEDGTTYDEITTKYIRAMGKINQKLAALADRVVEVVAGIPVTLK
ncbi:bifunctional adenosylcobalamin biosynthesis protein CobP [Lachnospiraceae bacterium]|jgi:adenosylcobinamide kinase/adenosylcobinamide-phosphate guanylyltransferase|uniref:bifunctional adenosylcobinamide kinase/adenosylcobinamide-phosphate guanylyltransferase n=1 Tax=Sporofaciens sp. JLR.KK001 TaxID=3112621 RepID=UPI0014338B84|nr:bifunctional adenosylcobalamin biosynthesis protein CobP [Lachnospiraceae bacterium]